MVVVGGALLEEREREGIVGRHGDSNYGGSWVQILHICTSTTTNIVVCICQRVLIRHTLKVVMSQ